MSTTTATTTPPRALRLLLLLFGMGLVLVAINWNELGKRRRREYDGNTNNVGRRRDMLRMEDDDEKNTVKHRRSTNNHTRTQRTFTVFTSSIEIRTKEMIAMKSWVHSGAQDIVLFVDDVVSSQAAIARDALLSQTTTTIQILENPHPKSPHGKVRLSRIMRVAENVTSPLNWMLYLNADILLSRRIRTVLQTIPPNLAATSMRMNCHLMNQSMFNHITTLAELEGNCRGCEIHSSGGTDWLLYPRGFWDARATKLGLTFDAMLDFFLGVDFWDNSLLSIAKGHVVDVSPVFLAGHIALPGYKEFEAQTKGRLISHNVSSTPHHHANISDIAHNGARLCRNEGVLDGRVRCRGRGIDGLQLQMCPSKRIGLFAKKIRYSLTVSFMKNWTRHHKWSGSTSWFLNSGRVATMLGCDDDEVVHDVWDDDWIDE